MSEVKPCAHCGRTCGDFAGGYAAVPVDGQQLQVCHPNAPLRPDCYVLCTVYHQKVGALIGVNESLSPALHYTREELEVMTVALAMAQKSAHDALTLATAEPIRTAMARRWNVISSVLTSVEEARMTVARQDEAAWHEADGSADR